VPSEAPLREAPQDDPVRDTVKNAGHPEEHPQAHFRKRTAMPERSYNAAVIALVSV
jgi:hypothetical protein